MVNSSLSFLLYMSLFYHYVNGSNRVHEDKMKRLLLNDQNYVEQMHTDIQTLKATVEFHRSQFIPNGEGKPVLKNGTELVYSGISGGGRYNEPGRSALPICVPHDPDVGPVARTSIFGTLYGMEYYDDTSEFGSGLHDKDVPCAVCRVKTATSVLEIPGKRNCYNGWNMEYTGMLASGYWNSAGPSAYICLDKTPDVLEGGVQNVDGYNIFPVKAYCGSLKCPPYVQDSLVYCVVCSNK